MCYGILHWSPPVKYIKRLADWFLGLKRRLNKDMKKKTVAQSTLPFRWQAPNQGQASRRHLTIPAENIDKTLGCGLTGCGPQYAHGAQQQGWLQFTVGR